MIKEYLKKYFAKSFYPTRITDWYLSKGYLGKNHQESFASFFSAQKIKGAVFYEEFKSLHNITRQFIKSGNHKIDSVIFIPKINDATYRKNNLCFVFFQGRNEFYESRFRDMAIQARETNARVLGFNHKGWGSSTGNTETILDLVDDGIAVIKYLLNEMNLSPNQIILQGNSLGAGVQEMVCEHYRRLYGFKFRQINSNSFSSLSAVLASNYHILFLEKIIKMILLYAEWEIIPGKDFYQTGIYRCHFRRLNDRTLAREAEYHSKVDIQKDCRSCPKGYSKTNRFLYNNCHIVYNGDSEKDPHLLSLHLFEIAHKKPENKHSIYSIINLYINQSEKYINP